jgi:hypothetical protein
VTVLSPTVLTAIGRLNVHARAGQGFACSGQRDAIYSYKRLAAMVLVAGGDVTPRFVKWTGTCARCTNGRFTHWSWDDDYSVACRDCGGSGKRTLRFTETTLPDGQVWHYPWEGFTGPGREIASAVGYELRNDGEYCLPDGSLLEWRDPGEWHPMLPAAAMPLEPLVADLNQVEDWIEDAPRPARGEPFWWIWSDADNFLHQRSHRRVTGEPSHGYRLDLGRVAGGCFACGNESDVTHCIGRVTNLFHWAIPVCKAHGGLDHPKDAPPAALITPAVRRWLDRHERVEEGS